LRGLRVRSVLSQQFETAGINEIVFKVPWEKLTPGPVGDYLEVIDYDPASQAFYDPVEPERGVDRRRGRSRSGRK